VKGDYKEDSDNDPDEDAHSLLKGYAAGGIEEEDIVPSRRTEVKIAVTETWLNDDTEDAYFLPGYDLVTKSRSGQIGGGVGIFVSTHLITHCGLIYVVCQTT